jgi:hypothetical protein
VNGTTYQSAGHPQGVSHVTTFITTVTRQFPNYQGQLSRRLLAADRRTVVVGELIVWGIGSHSSPLKLL